MLNLDDVLSVSACALPSTLFPNIPNPSSYCLVSAVVLAVLGLGDVGSSLKGVGCHTFTTGGYSEVLQAHAERIPLHASPSAILDIAKDTCAALCAIYGTDDPALLRIVLFSLFPVDEALPSVEAVAVELTRIYALHPDDAVFVAKTTERCNPLPPVTTQSLTLFHAPLSLSLSLLSAGILLWTRTHTYSLWSLCPKPAGWSKQARQA
jgi:hypothetical protein